MDIKTMSCAISLQQITKSFPPAVLALDSIDLEVSEGEFMVVVGPSGCGKSTLLRLVAGLESPTRGSMKILGQDASRLLPEERDIGMVFQHYALFPHLSVRDNMAYGLKVRKLSAPEIRKKVENVAKKLDIYELLSRKPAQLSGGQRQRVALGRLLSSDPKIHLFDEPLGNLDPQFRVKMRTELAHLHQDAPRTTLYVTHDQAEAMTLGERICVLRKGKILQTGTPEEIYHRPSHRFVAEFFGSPGVVCLDGRLKKGEENSLIFQSGPIQFPVPDQDLPLGSITLGIRPENWLLTAPEEGAILGSINRVENLGDHQILEVSTPHNIVSIKTYSSKSKVKQNIGISPDLEKAHWFERYTGKRI